MLMHAFAELGTGVAMGPSREMAIRMVTDSGRYEKEKLREKLRSKKQTRDEVDAGMREIKNEVEKELN